MDTHGTMASIHKFNNAKSVIMEYPQNINPAKIEAHLVCTVDNNITLMFRFYETLTL